jgi:hypothetical protein
MKLPSYPSEQCTQLRFFKHWLREKRFCTFSLIVTELRLKKVSHCCFLVNLLTFSLHSSHTDYSGLLTGQNIKGKKSSDLKGLRKNAKNAA